MDFGDAQKQNAAAGSLLELKARAGTAVFELSSAQVNEAINAFERLREVNMNLASDATDHPYGTKPDRVVEAMSAVGGKSKFVSNFRWDFQVFQRSAGPEWNPWPKDCPAPQLRGLSI
jgi:hypothetical protein